VSGEIGCETAATGSGAQRADGVDYDLIFDEATFDVSAEPPTSGAEARVRELEAQLEERTRELAQARAELDAFSYSISHDLRAPLRAIDGFGQALAHDYGGLLDEQAHHYLDRVRAGAQRMSALIDALLELSRIQRAPMRRTEVDLSALAQRILAGFARAHPERRVEAVVAPQLEACADPYLMNVLLEKLLENSWKFTSKVPEARIELGQEELDGEQWLFVSDNGAGFDMAYAARLFSPFQRLHKPSDFDGVGIGLSIAQRIIARHDGQITAHGEAQRGARFSFRLKGCRE
jgi:light-regulated signal transduction histidine kinase (bacteriophytochrome)